MPPRQKPTMQALPLELSIVLTGAAPSAPAEAAPAEAAPAALAAPAPAHKSQPTLLGFVKAMCEEAQKLAYPNAGTPVHCASTDRGGADYQNNSALAVFGALKKSGLPDGIKKASDVAEAIAAKMRECDAEGIVSKLEVAGPGFINIFLSAEWISKRVHAINAVGALPPPDAPRKVIVDFSSPNVAKEMHVGHLRSTIIGDTLCRILGFVGHEVERVNHVGDWGTQFGMLIGHLKTVFPDYATKPPPIADLQQFYKDAKAKFDADEDFKKVAHEEVVRLQGGDGASRYAWGQICDVSRREFEKVYSRLDVSLTEVGESFYNEYIPAVVNHLEEIGLVQMSGGAKVIFPPGTKHEQPLIVTKSDGGFSYDATDMAAIWYRLLDARADWLIYVTDAGQGPHFELVFQAAIAAGWTKEGTRLDHTPFGVVCGEDGKKFKTRSGDVVRLVDLLDEAVERMLTGLQTRKAEQVAALAERQAEAAAAGDASAGAAKSGKVQGLLAMEDAEMANAARVLGYGAVKYADLKGNRNSNYIFSYDRMLDPKGNTAVYLLYAGARIASILRQSNVDLAALAASGVRVELKDEAELALGRGLLRFQEAIELTISTLLPSALCEYLYDLCGLFTKFYQACKVIGSPEQGPRLLLLLALEKVLRQGYALLGIGYLERI